MRMRSLLGLSLLGSILSSTTASAQSQTVRIEPRAYYGAVVTLEQGVRVWRPLPPTRTMIINPDGRTPLNLSLAEVNETVTSHNYNHGGVAAAEAGHGSNVYGVPGYFRGRAARQPGHHRHGRPVGGIGAR